MATRTVVQRAVEQEIEHNHILVIGKASDPNTKKARDALDKVTTTRKNIDVDVEYPNDADTIQDYLATLTGRSEGPRVFIHGKFIGGRDEVEKKQKSGELKKLIDNTEG